MTRSPAPSGNNSDKPAAAHRGKCSRGRHAIPRKASARMLFALQARAAVWALGASMALFGHAALANTADNVVNGQSDLTNSGGTTYSAGTPTTTSDVTFLAATTYSPTAFTLNNNLFNLSIGTLDDLDGSQTLTIQNTTSGSTSTITLNGGSDSVSPSTSDLLYVASGGTLNIATGGAGTLNLALGASGNFDIVGNATIGGASTGGVISGAYGFTKTGAGTLTLSGTNTYTGGTTLSSGGLTVGNNSALGTGTLTLNGGLLSNSTGVTLANNLNSTGTTIVEAVGGNMTFSGVVSGAGTINVDGNGSGANSIQFNDTLANFTGSVLYTGTSNDNLFFNAALDTSAAFVLSGSTGAARDLRISGSSVIGSLSGTGGRIGGDNGTAILIVNQSTSTAFAGQIGADNAIGLTKTGTGTLSLTGSNVYTLATTVNQGVLKLDFSAAGAPTTNIINNSGNSSALSLGGGTLSLTGKASTTDSQRFNGTSISGGGSAIVLNANATANPLSLSLGAITRTAGVGGTVDFTLPTGTQSSTNGITTTNTNNANGTLLDFTVGGTDWAAVSGGNIVSYTSNGGTYVTAGTNAAAYANANVDVTSSVSPGGAITPNTLRFNTAVPTTLGMLAGTTDVVSSGGVLVTSNVGSNNTMIAGGTLEGSSGSSLDIMQNSGGTMTIGSVIANNGSATGLNKSGTGTLVLSGANTYSGTTTVSGGTLQIGNGTTSSGLSGAITLAGGTFLSDTTGGSGGGFFPTITLTANSAIGDIGNTTFINFNTGINTNGFTLTYAGSLANVYGSANGNGYNGGGFAGEWYQNSAISGNGPINIVSGDFTAANSSLGTGLISISAGATMSLSGVTLTNNITLNGGAGALGLGAINDQNTTSSTLSGAITLAGGVSAIGTMNSSLTLSGVVTGSGGLEKDNNNTLTLSNADTYTGATTITGGTLALTMSSTAANSTLYNGVTANTLTLGGQPAAYANQSNSSQTPTLSVTGAASTNNVQSFSNTVANYGVDTITATPGSSGGIVLNLGTLTHNAGANLNFTNTTAVSAPSPTNEITAVGTGLNNGIIGGWATVNGTDWATVNGSNQIVAYTGYTTTTGAIASAPATNVKSTGATITMAASGETSINSLLITAANPTITIGSGNTLNLGTQGGIFTTTSGTTTNITGGTLDAGGSTLGTAGELDIQNVGSSNITISSVIANNNASTGSANSTGGGAVTVVFNQGNGNSNSSQFSGTNTYSGGTYILQGRLAAGGDSAAFGTGSVTVLDGGEAYFGATFSNNFAIEGNGTNENLGAIRAQNGTVTGTVTLLADASIGAAGGTGTFNGQITGTGNLTIGPGGGTINLGNASATNLNNWTGNTTISTTVNLTAANNQLPSGAGYGNVSVNGTLTLGGFNLAVNGLAGTSTITNTTTGHSVLSIGHNKQSFAFAGTLTDSSSTASLTLEKDGSGLVELTDSTANAYHGGTIVNSGTLQLGNSTALGATTGALTVNGSGVTAANTTASSSNTSTGGTLDLNNNSLTVGSLSGSGTGGGIISSYNNTTASALTLTVNNTAATTTTFNGSIQNGTATSLALTLGSTNTGTLDLTGANTYSGLTTVAGGSLQLGFGGSLANLNNTSFTGTASTLILGDSSGVNNETLTGNLGMVGTNAIVGGNASANSTLTLNGAGTVTFANAFGGSTATSKNLNLVIAGTGTTPASILTGTSTYTGTTTVNTGDTLSLTNGVLAATAVTVNSGGTLTGTGNNSTTGVIGGTVTAVGGSTISLTGATASTALRVTGSGGITLGTTGSYTPANYTTLNYTLGTSNAVEQLNTTGTLTINTGGSYVSITNPTQTGTFVLANYVDSSAPTGFSLSSTTAGVLTQNVGRNTETLSDTSTALTLMISGAATPGLAYFDGVVSKTWNDVSNPSFVNFSTNLAGTADAGNIPGAVTDVILNASNAAANQGSPITEELGTSTTINSLRVNANDTTTLGLITDTSTVLTLNAQADSNIVSDGTFSAGSQTAGVGIVIASGANPFTINVPVALGAGNSGSQSWTNNSASLFTVAGTVTGRASVADTLNLANTSSGGTTISGLIANGGAGTLALVVNNTGAGSTILSNSGNSYSGGTTLTAGTLQVPAGVSGSTGALGSTSGTLTVNGGTLDLDGTSQAVGNFTGGGGTILNSVAGAQTLTIGTGNATGGDFTGVIEDNGGTGGTVGLIKTGTGILELGGVNTYSGGTSLNAGVLQVNSASSLGNASGALTFGGSSTLEILTGYTTTRAFTISGTSGVVATINTDASQTLTDNGNITGGSSTGGLTKIGSGTLNLGGNDTYSGITTITAGTLQLGSATAIPTGNTVATGSNLVVSSGTTLDLNGYNLSVGVTGSAPSGTGTITNIGGGTTSNLTLGAAFGGTLTDGVGSSAGTGVMSVTYNVNGSISVGGTKTYTGGTIIALNTRFSDTTSTAVGSGLITVQNGGQWFQGTAVTNNFNITGNGTTNTDNPAYGAMRLAGQTETGTVTLAADATLSAQGGTGTFAGQITGSSINAGNLAANHEPSLYLFSSTVVLDNTSLTNLNNWGGNTYINGYIGNPGGSSFNATTLQLGASQQIPTTSSVTVSNQGGTLDMHGFNDSIDALIGATGTSDVVDDLAAGASTLTVGSNNGTGTYAGLIKSTTGSLSLTKTGTGTETLTGQNTYTGTTTIAGGDLTVGVTDVAGTSGALGKAGNITFTGGTLQYGTGFTNDYSSRIVGSTTAPISIDPNGNTVVFASPLAASNTDGLSLVGGTAGTLAVTASSPYSGYSGTTTITTGTLQIGNGGTVGSLSTASPIVDNATLAFNRTNTITQGTDFDAAAISGTGVVTQSGTGTTVLNAANTYTGVTTINAGILSTGATGTFSTVNTPSSVGESSLVTLNGGTLQYASTGAADSTDIYLTLTAAGGALDASGTNAVTFSNPASVNLTGSGQHTLTLTGSSTAANTFAGELDDNISGSVSNVAKTGVGEWILSGGNTYSGTTTIGTAAAGATNQTSATANGGTLGIAVGGLAGSGSLSASPGATTAITVNNGGTLFLAGSGQGRFNSSALSPIALGTTGGTGVGGTILRDTGAYEGTGASTTNGGSSTSGSNSVGLGALTLASNSTIDFGTSGKGTLVFTSFNPTSSNFVLNVTDYTNTTTNGSTISGVDGTDDRLIFMDNVSADGNLADITFAGSTSDAQISLGGGFYEIVPTAVPEPATWAAGLLCVGAFGLGLRRRTGLASFSKAA